MLDKLGIEYFNPVVPEWDEQAQANELRERETADFVLYTLTPKMEGVYSIAEVVDDSNKRPDKTVFVLLSNDETVKWAPKAGNSMQAVKKLLQRNGVATFDSLEAAADYLWVSQRRPT